ncbi:MAG: CDGSH iron-sulfur domain-containing protein [Candidatus Pacebacteria bacterium]|nr:CDGSH iron-sulfur domain-containing protein [Candidatus Paceibacterota bacterium]
MDKNKKIKIEKNGPYRVSGNIPLEKEFVVPDENNNPLSWQKGEKYKTEEEYCLCRCGKSQNKPFCDFTHQKIEFDGTETASKEDYKQQAENISGPGMDLMDASNLCARARFCHRHGGTWDLTAKSDDSKSKKIAIEEACNCPSGRLTAINKKTGEPIEPEFSPSISITEDIPAKASGPLWAKGKIQIEGADGSSYENRNRQTICRCGKSSNKPFCDGSHIENKFDDKV